jgi:hypothetical protein
LYGDRYSKDEQLIMRQLCENPKVRKWRAVEVKVHVLFYGHSSRTFALTQIKFDAEKHHGHEYKFYFNH